MQEICPLFTFKIVKFPVILNFMNVQCFHVISFYLFIYYLFIYLSIYLFIHLFILCLFVCLFSVCVFVLLKVAFKLLK